jgi:hypothetical protein
MTLAIGFITPGRLALATIQVSRLSWLILALSLALAGLAVDVVLSPGPVGLIALCPALVGLSLAGAVLVEEIVEGVGLC